MHPFPPLSNLRGLLTMLLGSNHLMRIWVKTQCKWGKKSNCGIPRFLRFLKQAGFSMATSWFSLSTKSPTARRFVLFSHRWRHWCQKVESIESPEESLKNGGKEHSRNWGEESLHKSKKMRLLRLKMQFSSASTIAGWRRLKLIYKESWSSLNTSIQKTKSTLQDFSPSKLLERMPIRLWTILDLS